MAKSNEQGTGLPNREFCRTLRDRLDSMAGASPAKVVDELDRIATQGTRWTPPAEQPEPASAMPPINFTSGGVDCVILVRNWNSRDHAAQCSRCECCSAVVHGNGTATCALLIPYASEWPELAVDPGRVGVPASLTPVLDEKTGELRIEGDLRDWPWD